VADLLQQLDHDLSPEVCGTVATALLTHPLVSGSNMPFGWGDRSGWRRLLGGSRLGNVIQREEFTKLLMALAAGGAASSGLPEPARASLQAALARNGIANPDASLKDIRTIALRLEKSAPALSNAARQTAAILEGAGSDLVGKINSWFDQTMDRTSQRFTASTRAITFAGAFIVAFGLQVDTMSLFNRLSADDILRDKLVHDALSLPAIQTEGENAAAPALNGEYRRFLSEAGAVSLPAFRSLSEWRAGFDGRNLAGILMTALLLSLGAPFWYGVLRNLLQLRSVLAAKDDEQRGRRQLSDPGAAPPTATGNSSALNAGV
jgi:hypothetical protein